ncbi:hypothetical protein [Croceimicrobium sp.]|uniref:hypothetical protein n=1 Tax=Croceimicrobium sp. TaxID=2828340 RepID=UPI003BA843F8
MKVFLSILTLFILFCCTNPESQQMNDSQQEIVDSTQDTFTVNGLWAMPNYVDSVLAYKSISKFRKQWPAWFAILIEIDKDTLRSYGSIINIEAPYMPKSDTLQVFEKTLTGQWILTLNEKTKKLELRNSDSKREDKDTNVYVFEKRPDLSFLLDTPNPAHYTSISFTSYFHDQLFAGTYELIGTNQQVTLSSNGQIKGFQDFHKYTVDNYFGTLHPYNSLDNIIFKRELPENSNEIDWELFKWEFHGDTLILTQFYWEILKNKGRELRSENWKLSGEQIKMIRKLKLDKQ